MTRGTTGALEKFHGSFALSADLVPSRRYLSVLVGMQNVTPSGADAGVSELGLPVLHFRPVFQDVVAVLRSRYTGPWPCWLGSECSLLFRFRR